MLYLCSPEVHIKLNFLSSYKSKFGWSGSTTVCRETLPFNTLGGPGWCFCSHCLRPHTCCLLQVSSPTETCRTDPPTCVYSWGRRCDGFHTVTVLMGVAPPGMTRLDSSERMERMERLACKWFYKSVRRMHPSLDFNYAEFSSLQVARLSQNHTVDLVIMSMGVCHFSMICDIHCDQKRAVACS